MLPSKLQKRVWKLFHFVICCNIVFFKDSSQIELLKELMDLQKDMVVMLLSMLEGNFGLLLQTWIKSK